MPPEGVHLIAYSRKPTPGERVDEQLDDKASAAGVGVVQSLVEIDRGEIIENNASRVWGRRESVQFFNVTGEIYHFKL